MSQLEWNFGFRNHTTSKFLTQETFGFVLNCNGTSLKKKQTFTLVSSNGSIHIRTHLNKYMYGDKDGKVKGDADAPSKDTQWTIEPQADGTWALKSAFGFYFHGSGESLTAFVKDLPADGRWVAVLAMHPQINLYNVMRKRYVHFAEGELRCDEDIPWGEDSLLTLVFFEEHPEGRYGLVAANGQYLTAAGGLVSKPTADCEFLLGFHDDQISFCDANRQYLSCVGAKGTLKVNKKAITKDELFVIQDSEPQFTILSNFKNKQVSVRSNVEVKADQTTVEDTERFQLEISADGKGHIRTNKLFYWTVGSDGVISLSSDKRTNDTSFTVVYEGPVTKFLGPNGKFVTVRPNGALVAAGERGDESAAFTFTLINRPQIVLRGQFGFVGIKGASGRIECNKATGVLFKLREEKGAYTFESAGKAWTVDQDGVASSASGAKFFLEFTERSKIMIKHADSGKYLQGEQNGGFKAVGSSATIDTLWEF